MAWITKRALALGLVTGLALAVPEAPLADGLSGAPYDICCSEKEREAARADLEAVDAELASLRLGSPVFRRPSRPGWRSCRT